MEKHIVYASGARGPCGGLGQTGRVVRRNWWKARVRDARNRFRPDGRRLAYADNPYPDIWTAPLNFSDAEHPQGGEAGALPGYAGGGSGGGVLAGGPLDGLCVQRVGPRRDLRAALSRHRRGVEDFDRWRQVSALVADEPRVCFWAGAIASRWHNTRRRAIRYWPASHGPGRIARRCHRTCIRAMTWPGRETVVPRG